MDVCSGDDLVAAASPWLLASERLCAAIRAARLTGLHVGMLANVDFSDAGKVLARLGEIATDQLPRFRIVVPETPDHRAEPRCGDSMSWRADQLDAAATTV